MIKTFTSYHHANDQGYKDELITWAVGNGLITDISVKTGDIDENLDPQSIRRTVRDYFLRDSEVTILLCGNETRFRKHVDWELKSSMIDGTINRRSGILVIDLPTSSSNSWYVTYPGEKEIIYPGFDNWRDVNTYASFEEMFPDMPRRILENLILPEVKISVVPWDQVFGNVDCFRFLLEKTAAPGAANQYDLSRKMRMKNYNPAIDSIDWRT